MNTCVISFVVDGGSTTYLAISGNEPAVPTVLHEYTYYISDEGTYNHAITASFSAWTEAATPTVTLTESFTVVVEPLCPVTSFLNVPSVSTTTSVDYIIASGPTSFEFEIRFEPQSCNYIKSYIIYIDGVDSSPSWVSIDMSATPHKVVIDTTDGGLEGIYSVGVECQLNTTPATVSTDRYIFVASLAYDPCSGIQFDS